MSEPIEIPVRNWEAEAGMTKYIAPDAALLLTPTNFRTHVNAAIIRHLGRRWRCPAGADSDSYCAWKQWFQARLDYLENLKLKNLKEDN